MGNIDSGTASFYNPPLAMRLAGRSPNRQKWLIASVPQTLKWAEVFFIEGNCSAVMGPLHSPGGLSSYY
jgi:hypothetical protein